MRGDRDLIAGGNDHLEASGSAPADEPVRFDPPAVVEQRVVPSVEQVVVLGGKVTVLDGALPCGWIAVGTDLVESPVGQEIRCGGAGVGEFRQAQLDLPGASVETNRNGHDRRQTYSSSIALRCPEPVGGRQPYLELLPV